MTTELTLPFHVQLQQCLIILIIFRLFLIPNCRKNFLKAHFLKKAIKDLIKYPLRPKLVAIKF